MIACQYAHPVALDAGVLAPASFPHGRLAVSARERWMSVTSAGGTRWADDANAKLAEMIAALPEEQRVARENLVRRAAEAFARGQSQYQLGDIVSLEAMCVGWI